ncbi:MAG TPA: hypothetical protein H9879_08080 [Candidatus Alistipes intestinipullorum]|nr:hypothetical protein [Candidatus Alistipes intestinipullorum]
MRRILYVAAFITTLSVAGQEPTIPSRRSLRPDSLRTATLPLPDTMEQMIPWQSDYRYMEPLETHPVVSMSSLLTVIEEHLPAQVTVLDNNMLRLNRRFLLSNGQAWNHGPFPDSFLDARTISMPLPR